MRRDSRECCAGQRKTKSQTHADRQQGSDGNTCVTWAVSDPQLRRARPSPSFRGRGRSPSLGADRSAARVFDANPAERITPALNGRKCVPDFKASTATALHVERQSEVYPEEGDTDGSDVRNEPPRLRSKITRNSNNGREVFASMKKAASARSRHQ